MEQKIAIIAAMQEEMEEIKKIMDNLEEKTIQGLTIQEGEINGSKAILVQSGVGKVNAARTTQILVDHYSLKSVINVGSAGGLREDLNIGDIVIGDNLVQHDFDITAFGHPKGHITELGINFKSNQELVKKAEKAIQAILQQEEKLKIVKGTIASGDIFCTSVEMKHKIHSKFQASCVEMEGAAIAQVCTLDQIPFIIIRSISDVPNGNNNIEFDEYLKYASTRCAQFIKKMIS